MIFAGRNFSFFKGIQVIKLVYQFGLPKVQLFLNSQKFIKKNQKTDNECNKNYLLHSNKINILSLNTLADLTGFKNL